MKNINTQIYSALVIGTENAITVGETPLLEIIYRDNNFKGLAEIYDVFRFHGPLTLKDEYYEYDENTYYSICVIELVTPVDNFKMNNHIKKIIKEELTEALNELKNEGYRYTDLKPHNMGFDINGKLKLIDLETIQIDGAGGYKFIIDKEVERYIKHGIE